MSGNLVIPLFLWGRNPPSHRISALSLMPDQTAMLTGTFDGQICIWKRTAKSITPKYMIFTQPSPITALSPAGNASSTNQFISASRNGQSCLWDVGDGRCVDNSVSSYVHTLIKPHAIRLTSGNVQQRMFCCGHYPEIAIMEPGSLQILTLLVSRVEPDWITSFTILRPPHISNDNVVALSSSGMVKIWSLIDMDTRDPTEPIYEDESKQIKCQGALSIEPCYLNQRSMMLTSSLEWQIYDASDFSELVSEKAPEGEHWLSGYFIKIDKVMATCSDGSAWLFQLPRKAILGEAAQGAPPFDHTFCYCRLNLNSAALSKSILNMTPVFSFIDNERGQNHHGGHQNSNGTSGNNGNNGNNSTNHHYPGPSILIRADSNGNMHLWNVPQVTDRQIASLQQEQFKTSPQIEPSQIAGIEKSWNELPFKPSGIIENLSGIDNDCEITATLYVASQGRLIIGRQDGTIILTSATQTLISQLLRHNRAKDWPSSRILSGHSGQSITCLLYPYEEHPRYDPAHLLSGGEDFSVYLWDLKSGSRLCRFSAQAGPILSISLPPPNCNPRVLQSVVSVAGDHSVALIGLKDQKIALLASRHLYPVRRILWRPLDDFLIVQTTDSTIYVWQMETGHLDRMVSGLVAEDVIAGCEEVAEIVGDGEGEEAEAGASQAVQMIRAIKHKNLSAIKKVAALSGKSGVEKSHLDDFLAPPMTLQPIRTYCEDPDSHCAMFNIEALIIGLLAEEHQYGKDGVSVNNSTSSASSTSDGGNNSSSSALIGDGGQNSSRKSSSSTSSSAINNNNNHHHRLPPDASPSLSGFLARAKDKVESVVRVPSPQTQRKLQDPHEKMSKSMQITGESSLHMEVAQLLMSLLHGWYLDQDLDKVCQGKLGLLRPCVPLCFGLISRQGFLSVLMPSGVIRSTAPAPPPVPSRDGVNNSSKQTTESPPAPVMVDRFEWFAKSLHWQLSNSLTTQHLLTVISTANTLMSMSNAGFLPDQEKKRRIIKRMSLHQNMTASSGANPNLVSQEIADQLALEATHIKQGWSLLAALHCVLIPELVPKDSYKPPRIELLARRWQERCLELREAAQALLLRELNRLGSNGRKSLIERWSPFLPTYLPASLSIFGDTGLMGNSPVPSLTSSVSTPTGTAPQGGGIPPPPNPRSQSSFPGAAAASPNSNVNNNNLNNNSPGPATNAASSSSSVTTTNHHPSHPFHTNNYEPLLAPSDAVGFGASANMQDTSVQAVRRNQATSVVVLGVIGAEFGQEIASSNLPQSLAPAGFNAGDYSLARATSQALLELLVQPATPLLPLFSPLRRAAMDLLGRGFVVWQPYLDISKVLLGLLQLSINSEKVIPQGPVMFPLAPEADACRTARHALTLIATARPPAFITALSKEVARHNTTGQALQHAGPSPILRARTEILNLIAVLTEKQYNDVVDMMIPLGEILVHCLDTSLLKHQSLSEIFPPITKFYMVSYCSQSRRMAFGSPSGAVAIHELRAGKCQTIPAHSRSVTALAFSEDGKHLATYSADEGKVNFWQASQSFLGMGSSQIKCVRQVPAPMSFPVQTPGGTPQIFRARLIWMAAKSLSLMLPNGKEHRFAM